MPKDWSRLSSLIKCHGHLCLYTAPHQNGYVVCNELLIGLTFDNIMTAVSETVDSVNTYPLCLNGSGLPRHALQDLQVRLEGVSGKLFLRATPATVHVLQIPTGGHGMSSRAWLGAFV